MSSIRRHIALAIGMLAVGISAVRAAGSNPTEEAEIRKLVSAIDAKGNKGMSTADFIFWSGAYKRPIAAPDDPSQHPVAAGVISDRAPGSQKIVTTPIRLVVSDSKDLAYEYSNFTMEFDTKAGKHIKFDGGVLRVWQKQENEWKQAAIFARGYDD